MIAALTADPTVVQNGRGNETTLPPLWAGRKEPSDDSKIISPYYYTNPSPGSFLDRLLWRKINKRVKGIFINLVQGVFLQRLCPKGTVYGLRVEDSGYNVELIEEVWNWGLQRSW